MPTLYRIFGCLRWLIIYSLFIFEYTYKKSGCQLKCCSAFNTNALHLYKKSGTALLLFRYLRLSLCLNI